MSTKNFHFTPPDRRAKINFFCGHPVELISLPRLSPNSSHGSRLPNPACPLSTQNEEFLVYLKEIYLKWRFLPEIRISPECWGSVSDRFKVGGRGKYSDKHTEKKRFYLKIVFEHWKSLLEILLEIKLINFEFFKEYLSLSTENSDEGVDNPDILTH